MSDPVEKALWDAFTASNCWPAELKGFTYGGAKLIAAAGDAPFVADYMDAIKNMALAARAALSVSNTEYLREGSVNDTPERGRQTNDRYGLHKGSVVNASGDEYPAPPSSSLNERVNEAKT